MATVAKEKSVQSVNNGIKWQPLYYPPGRILGQQRPWRSNTLRKKLAEQNKSRPSDYFVHCLGERVINVGVSFDAMQLGRHSGLWLGQLGFKSPCRAAGIRAMSDGDCNRGPSTSSIPHSAQSSTSSIPRSARPSTCSIQRSPRRSTCSIQRSPQPSTCSIPLSAWPTTCSIQRTPQPSTCSIPLSARPSTCSIQRSSRPSTCSTQRSALPSTCSVQRPALPSTCSIQRSALPSTSSIQRPALPSTCSIQRSSRPSTCSIQRPARPSTCSVQHSTLQTLNKHRWTNSHIFHDAQQSKEIIQHSQYVDNYVERLSSPNDLSEGQNTNTDKGQKSLKNVKLKNSSQNDVIAPIIQSHNQNLDSEVMVIEMVQRSSRNKMAQRPSTSYHPACSRTVRGPLRSPSNEAKQLMQELLDENSSDRPAYNFTQQTDAIDLASDQTKLVISDSRPILPKIIQTVMESNDLSGDSRTVTGPKWHSCKTSMHTPVYDTLANNSTPLLIRNDNHSRKCIRENTFETTPLGYDSRYEVTWQYRVHGHELDEVSDDGTRARASAKCWNWLTNKFEPWHVVDDQQEEGVTRLL